MAYTFRRAQRALTVHGNEGHDLRRTFTLVPNLGFPMGVPVWIAPISMPFQMVHTYLTRKDAATENVKSYSNR